MSKHTDGPWIVFVSDIFPNLYSIEHKHPDSEDNDWICDVYDSEANANLIASSPDLLEQEKKNAAILINIREALSSLPIDCLGEKPETHDCPAFPIRDELIDSITNRIVNTIQIIWRAEN